MRRPIAHGRFDLHGHCRKPLGFAKEDEDEDVNAPMVEIPFQKVNLTFKGIHYTVNASTSNEKLELLKGVDGFIEAGKMTALMGSSGTSVIVDCFAATHSYTRT